jgi:hypothetical protein
MGTYPLGIEFSTYRNKETYGQQNKNTTRSGGRILPRR